MSVYSKIKYFSYGCLGGVMAHLYITSIAEQRLQFRRKELMRLKLMLREGVDSPKIDDLGKQMIDNNKDQDVIFPLLYHTYLNYLVNSVIVFAKFLTDEGKREKIDHYIRSTIKGYKKEENK